MRIERNNDWLPRYSAIPIDKKPSFSCFTRSHHDLPTRGQFFILFRHPPNRRSHQQKHTRTIYKRSGHRTCDMGVCKSRVTCQVGCLYSVFYCPFHTRLPGLMLDWVWNICGTRAMAFWVTACQREACCQVSRRPTFWGHWITHDFTPSSKKATKWRKNDQIFWQRTPTTYHLLSRNRWCWGRAKGAKIKGFSGRLMLVVFGGSLTCEENRGSKLM